jgi:hypothetical protein
MKCMAMTQTILRRRSRDFPAGYTITAWVQMKDFFIFGSTGLVFYGFIAHSNTDPKQAILAIRGTDAGIEWLDDITSLGLEPFVVPNCGNVGIGWENIFLTLELVPVPPAGQAMMSLKPVGRFSAQVREHLLRHAASALGPNTNTMPHAIAMTGPGQIEMGSSHSRRSDRCVAPKWSLCGRRWAMPLVRQTGARDDALSAARQSAFACPLSMGDGRRASRSSVRRQPKHSTITRREAQRLPSGQRKSGRRLKSRSVASWKTAGPIPGNYARLFNARWRNFLLVEIFRHCAPYPELQCSATSGMI